MCPLPFIMSSPRHCKAASLHWLRTSSEVLMDGDVPTYLIPLHIAGGPLRVAHAFPVGHTHARRGLAPSSLSNTSTSSFFHNYYCRPSQGSG